MKLISRYIQETALSFSFLLDRIIPAALYFLPVIIITRLGNAAQISLYSVFSSLFVSFVSIPLGFTSAVRYYSSSLKEGKYTAAVALVVTAIFSVIGIIAYFGYYFIFLYPAGYRNFYMLIAFALSIMITAPYYGLSSFNEGRKNIKLNNVCNIISVPMYLLALYWFYRYLDIVTSAVSAFIVTRTVMLVILGSGCRGIWKKFDKSLIWQTVKYGLPISVLFFLQKLVSTILISFLNHSVDISAFQIAMVLSMIMSLVSNAVFTNVFVEISKKTVHIGFSFVTSLINLTAALLVAVGFLKWFGINYFETYIQDSTIVDLMKNNINIICCMIIFDALMTAAVIVSRACGDVWKSQTLWLVGVIIALSVYQYNITFATSMLGLVAADLMCVVFLVCYFIKFYSKQKRNI